MNTTATFPFGSLAESLAALTRSADASALRAHLQGRRLPALGGDTEPAEIILRALGSTPNPQQLAADLAPVLAQVIDKSRAELQGGLTPSLRLLVDQILKLAADLPANAELAASLEQLTSDLERVLSGFWLQDPLAPPLARALVHQQTDARAERLWYRLLETSEGSSWTPQQRTILLSAWRGLLYIPPSSEEARANRVVNRKRIERGLLALETRAHPHEDGFRLLRLAIEILFNTFPRSPESWRETLGTLIDTSPAMLQEALAQQLPRIPPAPSMAVSSRPNTEAPQSALGNNPQIIESIRRSLEETAAENDRLRRENQNLSQSLERANIKIDWLRSDIERLRNTHRPTIKFGKSQSRQSRGSIESVEPLLEGIRP